MNYQSCAVNWLTKGWALFFYFVDEKLFCGAQSGCCDSKKKCHFVQKIKDSVVNSVFQIVYLFI